MKPVKQLVKGVRNVLPDIKVNIDEPGTPTGHWFIDFSLDGHPVVAEWHSKYGFGVSATVMYSFGTKPDERYQSLEETISRVIFLLQTKSRTS